jgi:serine phosphatase RsbU (regulator of sigma subunit)/PAS domain-containing protein
VSGTGQPPGFVLVDLAPAEFTLLGELPGRRCVSAAEMEAVLAEAAGSVAVVVIGSLAGSAVALVQRVHRLVPGAGVAVLTADPDAVRRQVAFAPGVPLDLLIAGADDGDLSHRLQRLGEASVERHEHAAILAAVARSAAVTTGSAPIGQTAVGALLEHAPIGVVVVSPAGDLLGWNRRAERLLALRPAMSGQPVETVVPGALSLVGPAAASGDPGTMPDATNSQIHTTIAGRTEVEISAVSSQTDQGRPVVLLLVVDVTARREAERDRDRLAAHVQSLERISESLMEALDVSESLSGLADALVPALADWVSIQVREHRDQLYEIAMRHRDPGLAAVTLEAERLKARQGCCTEPSRRAAGGERVLLPIVDADALGDHVPDAELRALVQRLGMGSALAVPIPGRTGVLGSLLLVKGPDGGRFGPADVPLAAEIGRRAGIALENARLYAGQRHVATELQQSLLTAPPVIPFADIAVRYVAAAQEAQVGGDWYDAFRQQGGDLTVVIGDVVGHDTRAAAAMGQLRALLRGISFTAAEGPAEVLARVDEAIEGLELATAATAVLAQLSPQDGDGSRSSSDPGLLVRWSNAGHPPPVLVDPGGRARLLSPSSGRADILLGVDAARPRATERATLPVGATLFLYTDGLVERRGQPLDEGTDALLALIEAHGQDDLERLCDEVLRGMVPQAGEDDVAIVAVRSLGRRGPA